MSTPEVSIYLREWIVKPTFLVIVLHRGAIGGSSGALPHWIPPNPNLTVLRLHMQGRCVRPGWAITVTIGREELHG